MTTHDGNEFLDVQAEELQRAALGGDYDQTARVMEHMLAEGLTVEQVSEAADGLAVTAQQRLREQRGQLVRKVFMEWAAQQEHPHDSWLIPWEELDAGQKEVDMRIGEAIAAAERTARGPAETNIVYAATAVLFHHRHELPNDVLRSLADIWMCASAARFGQPFETWWWDDKDPVYRTHHTAECEAQSGLYPEPWGGDDWDPEAGQRG
jgi:hypothetical protein